MRVSPARQAVALECVSVLVPIGAVEAFEQAFATACDTVGFFEVDEEAGVWRVEGVRPRGQDDGALQGAVAIASMMTGHAATLERADVEAEGWLARTASAFPAQLVGRRFAVRGTHLAPGGFAGRIELALDAGSRSGRASMARRAGVCWRWRR